MPRLKRPSVKQRKFVQALVKTGNATEAALAAYNTKDRATAQNIGSQNLDKPEVQAELEKALAKNNITLENVTDSVNKLATQEPYKVSGDTVLKANIELLKLLKAYPEKTSRHISQSIRVNLSQKNFSELIELNKQKQAEIEEILNS